MNIFKKAWNGIKREFNNDEMEKALEDFIKANRECRRAETELLLGASPQEPEYYDEPQVEIDDYGKLPQGGDLNPPILD
jgi:hypothetical protein